MLVYYIQMLDTPEEKIRFEQIYTKYRGMMYCIANGILKNDQDAEDAVHNAFIKMIKRFSKFQSAPLKDLAPQIAVIAKNEAISVLRKRKDEAPLEDWENFVEASETITDYQNLVDSFTRLPQTYRSVLEMKLLLGYSDREISTKLGISKNAVSSRISRGRQLLRNIVEKEGFLMEAWDKVPFYVLRQPFTLNGM